MREITQDFIYESKLVNNFYNVSLKNTINRYFFIKWNTGAYPINLHDHGLYQYFGTTFSTAWIRYTNDQMMNEMPSVRKVICQNLQQTGYEQPSSTLQGEDW